MLRVWVMPSGGKVGLGMAELCVCSGRRWGDGMAWDI